MAPSGEGLGQKEAPAYRREVEAEKNWVPTAEPPTAWKERLRFRKRGLELP